MGFIFLLLFYYSCSNFSPLALLCPSYPPPPHSHTVVHVHGSYIDVLCLGPSPSFHYYPPLYSPLVTQSVLCFHACGSILFVSLHCSLDCFIGEIIWYLSFTDWLISFNIIFSSSIHAIAKGRSSFCLSAVSIPLCKGTTVFYPLIY